MPRLLALFVFLSFVAGLALAQVPNTGDHEPHDPLRGAPAAPDVEEPPEWSEAKTKLPAYPKDRNLVSVEVANGATAGYRFLIDTVSLELGADNVVRYTVVIESPTGTRNVMFEGIHCDAGLLKGSTEYKTYAYGSGEGTFRRARAPKWKPIRRAGVMGFRAGLESQYFCNDLGYPYHQKEIVSRVKGKNYFRDHNEDGRSYAYPGYQ